MVIGPCNSWIHTRPLILTDNRCYPIESNGWDILPYEHRTTGYGQQCRILESPGVVLSGPHPAVWQRADPEWSPDPPNQDRPPGAETGRLSSKSFMKILIYPNLIIIRYLELFVHIYLASMYIYIAYILKPNVKGQIMSIRLFVTKIISQSLFILLTLTGIAVCKGI